MAVRWHIYISVAKAIDTLSTGSSAMQADKYPFGKFLH